MSWEETIKKRLHQVDPHDLLGSLELAIDLGPHLAETPFFVDENDLEDFLRLWYDELGPANWTHSDLARAICKEFDL